MRAALVALQFVLCLVGAANAVGPNNEPFCEKPKTGATVCEYRTMEQCQEAIKGRDATCVANPGNPTR